MTKYPIFLIVALIYLHLVSGCGTIAGNDLENQAKIGLQKEFKKFGNDIEIIELDKTNGMEKETDGIKGYSLIFDAKFKVQKAYKFHTSSYDADGVFPVSNCIYNLKNGTAYFIKTDNGWECQSVEFEMLNLLEQRPNK